MFAFYHFLFGSFLWFVVCVFSTFREPFRVSERAVVMVVVVCLACIVNINDSFGWEIYSTIAHGSVSFLSKERIRFLFRIVATQRPQFRIHVVVCPFHFLDPFCVGLCSLPFVRSPLSC